MIILREFAEYLVFSLMISALNLAKTGNNFVLVWKKANLFMFRNSKMQNAFHKFVIKSHFLLFLSSSISILFYKMCSLQWSIEQISLTKCNFSRKAILGNLPQRSALASAPFTPASAVKRPRTFDGKNMKGLL